ncbi:4-hydroxy-3-methylbut-2-enyl diphosphate reductase [Actinomadura rudentiformis]|uniref:4-hydroxy-3-methylbut-2-enyl diphosphate reductase n=1 Tax=Actinomadura rudentiformis TaxID=359158 RepID=A0A6H9Z8I6_9ACTN|nr:4-hydroxy-3-methylbut-2-enyl diphosphate reductase [Actinomadura rudentiformis]KAB2351738.1 4-hydroxy-3-methylbut-2-enyl diphosphate reductase [Actinomadura rudentiformis]
MDRTLWHESFAVYGVAVGEILVADSFLHPRRGLVECAVAPALAARLGPAARRGQAQLGQWHGEGLLYTTTYLTKDGHAEGFGVAAHCDDPAALATARETMDVWSRTPRMRRVLVSGVEPRCMGATRALRTMEETGRRGPAYVIGRPPEADGLIEIDDLSEVPDGGTVVFPAHGVPLGVRAEAAARGLRVVDATCPLVTEALGELRRFADRGDTVVIVGRRDHRAIGSFTGQAPDDTVLVENEEDIRHLDLPERISYVVETGMAADEAARLVTALRARYPLARGPHPDGWCYAASDRADTVRAIAEAADLMLICGDRDSADARELAGLTTGTPTQTLADLADLDPVGLADAATIGLAVALPAKPRLTAAVIQALAGLGPLSVVRRRVVSETAAIPGSQVV